MFQQLLNLHFISLGTSAACCAVFSLTKSQTGIKLRLFPSKVKQRQTHREEDNQCYSSRRFNICDTYTTTQLYIYNYTPVDEYQVIYIYFAIIMSITRHYYLSCSKWFLIRFNSPLLISRTSMILVVGIVVRSCTDAPWEIMKLKQKHVSGIKHCIGRVNYARSKINLQYQKT